MKTKMVFLQLLFFLVLKISNAQLESEKINSKILVDRDEIVKTLCNANYNPDYYLVAAHRGRWGYRTANAPENVENSLESIIYATQDPEIDMVEIDVKLSKDKKLIILHDNYLQRTTNFLDKFPGDGAWRDPSDQYGHYSNYYYYLFNCSSNCPPAGLNELYSKTNFGQVIPGSTGVPLFEEVINIFKTEKILVNMDIRDLECFTAAWNMTVAEDALEFIHFKFNFTKDYFFHNYFNALSESDKKKVLFSPIINQSHDGKVDAETLVQGWLDWDQTNFEYPLLPAGYESILKNTTTQANILQAQTNVRNQGKRRIHVFSLQPEYYRGGNKGNVNQGQCCTYVPIGDSRGDWDFLLAPKGQTSQGANGYILTDQPDALIEYLKENNRRKIENRK